MYIIFSFVLMHINYIFQIPGEEVTSNVHRHIKHKKNIYTSLTWIVKSDYWNDKYYVNE